MHGARIVALSERIEFSCLTLRIRLIDVKGRERTQIDARRETSPGAMKDQYPRLVVKVIFQKRGLNFVDHIVSDRIKRIRAVQFEIGDAVADRVFDGFVAAHDVIPRCLFSENKNEVPASLIRAFAI
jgi:hypothetical protein